MRKEGAIRLLARGLYDYPVKHSVLGTVAPSADAVARALVGRDAIPLQPSGAYAANVLGLSEQVPSRIVFLTDGPSRRVKLGKQEIILKQTVPRNLAAAGRKSGTLIQALRYLGQNQVDETVRTILRRQISDEERPAIRKDLVHAPAWIADFLRPLTEPVSGHEDWCDDYQEMLGPMFFGEVPAFEEILRVVGEFRNTSTSGQRRRRNDHDLCDESANAG